MEKSFTFQPSSSSVSVRDIVGLFIARTTTLRGDGVKGFTLIELLVVVLIIGILAAVALPQYQKAVEKSRAMQALTLLKSINEATDVYYLANGMWPQSFNDLSIDIPWTGHDTTGANIVDSRSNTKWAIQLYWDSNQVSDLSAIRLDGKYAGAGFSITKQNDNDVQSHQLVGKYLCEERLDGTKPFTGTAGSFCKEIVGATLYKNFTWARYYRLPW